MVQNVDLDCQYVFLLKVYFSGMSIHLEVSQALELCHSMHVNDPE